MAVSIHAKLLIMTEYDLMETGCRTSFEIYCVYSIAKRLIKCVIIMMNCLLNILEECTQSLVDLSFINLKKCATKYMGLIVFLNTNTNI